MPHSVVVMDRCSIHFREDVRELIERTGAVILPLAPYCPWDNAVEYLHSYVKAWLQRHDRWVAEVGAEHGIDTAFRSLDDGYARRTIEHCGY
jgi:transposase